ncbi:hypothetical protein [Thalassovita taeanensis]|uniref:Uncharacterized protein n=1 Tax=Thalassovita taeanensis TaxID=657014 RepID=A0A1H9GGF2_9RHOB|nr:hypothetical protein [Thalassovita taeanensis]SEQ49136.1 hypothetical protein SAMN04488092_107169 [Thalassovita taeanensis]
MEKQLVLYLDNCVFSKILEPGNAGLRRYFSNIPHRLAFSDIHLTEMRGNRDEYAKLLDDLNAVFVRNPGAIHNRYHPISSLDSGEPFRRFSEHLEFAPAFDAFEAILSFMQHLLGGRRESKMQDIAVSADARIKSSLAELLSSATGGVFEGMIANFYPRIDEVTQNISSLDVDSGWRWIDAHARVAREGDPMRDMHPLEKVNYLFSLLDPTESMQLVELFPKGFARHKVLKNGDMAGFAFMLFSLGLTKRKGIFSGSRQEKKFVAQFRDAMHIEEASRCDCFITFDQGAFELASASFAYAGFSTRTILLKGAEHKST